MTHISEKDYQEIMQGINLPDHKEYSFRKKPSGNDNSDHVDKTIKVINDQAKTPKKTKKYLSAIKLISILKVNQKNNNPYDILEKLGFIYVSNKGWLFKI